MSLHPLAGKKAPTSSLTNIPRLVSAYYLNEPDVVENESHKVSFGTSGHRGSSLTTTFNESHILSISQAICDYRKLNNITGPLYLGMDTHALSEAAFCSAIEVFVANEVEVRIQKGRGYTPTPVISHAILNHNKGLKDELADGVIITPSHNPPQDGGYKYNPPNGGPADSDITTWVQNRANKLLEEDLVAVEILPFVTAIRSGFVQEVDFTSLYVDDLINVIDIDAIKKANFKIGVDPLGGSGIEVWQAIKENYGLNIEIVNEVVDPTFSFMTLDKDGQIRMDCSSPYAMASLISLKDKFEVAVANDPDFDRHGIVTKTGGLMNPNHYLAVAIDYLYRTREWSSSLEVGKTLVSSGMIDKVAKDLDRTLCEVPVGFKWFVEGLYQGTMGFGGEESAGASFLRKDGSVWSTDKDGIILALLAAEILATTQQNPSQYYDSLVAKHGAPVYKRIDVKATLEQKQVMKSLSPQQIKADVLAGDKITQILTNAPGNNAAIGGLKVVTEHGWFAARPSGTENIYKIYLESFKGETHLASIEEEAQAIVSSAFAAAGL